MRFAYALIPALLFSLVTAHAQQAGQQVRRRSGMSLQTGAACTGISREECCGQKIEAAGLRAQGDYPSHVIKTTVALACGEENRVVTPQVCRSIVMSRGFAANQVDAICGPAQRECHKNGTCRTCVSELSKLNYQGSFHACQAVTYVPERAQTPVVVLRNGGAADGQTRFEITRRRTVLR